ncbi:galactitol-1-phosphate 5-dehydrogenase [Paenibacillus sp. CGMCC 1.16610]|uniref:Alcohol dehydrogenase catalytic domain-containing protein n=1 Tax=Paenibacillus anseongense TaxID=2682845 RepID=A0ABW9UHS2_9BACL|nr:MULTISPECIES: galactitol-1-phosphate 5-dehydrogenase [Paenibacillus]MBA2940254.1 galactitol-1-phosphate 5-dehydrogenase [Paenibacillus sp. CGMCC 1.16610]MVQ38708.1 alcohol dehydrogenase catalytic domain-containing protein [Paenibacillus anseongense]
MKALVYEGPSTMNIREVAKPIPGPNEVLIRVERVGICGSELSGFLGHNSLRKPPLIMGHEFSGVVEQVGSGGDGEARFRRGDRVTANPLVSCGRCRACTTGAAQLCPERQLIGAHRPGAFAEYVAIAEKNVYRLDDHVSFDEGAFAEPFACAVHICKLLRPLPTDRLLIMGAGPIGLLALQAAKVYGLQQVVVVDINEQRLEIAKELGAVTVTRVSSLVEGHTFDAAIDAVGMELTRQTCVESVRPGGRVIFTGLHEETSRLPINQIIRSEIQMTGAFAYHSDDFETALQWISEGRVSLSPWTKLAPLESGSACFEMLIKNPGKIAKILMTLDEKGESVQ